MKRKLKKLDLHTDTLRQLDNSSLEKADGAITNTAPCSGCSIACSGCTKPCSVCIVCA